MGDEMECPCCKKVYKSKQYLKCHLAYPSNTRCKAVWEGRVLGILDHTSAGAGNKRAHEAMNAPSDGNESACDEFVSCGSLSLSSDGSARKSVDGNDYLSDDGSVGDYIVANVHDIVSNSDNSEDEGVSLDNDDDENLEPVKKVPSCSALDLHAMLDALLSSYRQVEKDGFMWNLHYRGNHYLVEFVPFILFVKGDTQ